MSPDAVARVLGRVQAGRALRRAGVPAGGHRRGRGRGHVPVSGQERLVLAPRLRTPGRGGVVERVGASALGPAQGRCPARHAPDGMHGGGPRPAGGARAAGRAGRDSRGAVPAAAASGLRHPDAPYRPGAPGVARSQEGQRSDHPAALGTGHHRVCQRHLARVAHACRAPALPWDGAGGVLLAPVAPVERSGPPPLRAPSKAIGTRRMILTRGLKSRVLRQCLGRPYWLLNLWIWTHLPASVRHLRPVRSYGTHLHTLVRLRAARRQYFGTFFFRNRPELELLRGLVDQRTRGAGLDIAVLACSKRADADSIAWTIRSARPDVKLRMHAVDISREVLDFAARGVSSIQAPDGPDAPPRRHATAGGAAWTTSTA